MGKPNNTLEHLMKRVIVDANGCWVWQGSLTNGGYGQTRYLGKLWRAHRLFYTLLVDPIADPKTFVCHQCDNPRCVNPNHMFLGDNQDNLTDMANKGRARNQWTGKLNN
jgi:hypothetical protein